MKSSNNAGSVYQRKDGRWAAAITDPITGRRRYIYAATEGEARRKLRGMTSRADSGAVVVDARTSLRTYVAAWLEDRAGRRRAPSTVGEYAWRLDRYVLPSIGGLRLGEITVVHVEDLLDDLAAQGLSESTVKAVRNALAAVLTDAIRARHLREGNVARQAQMPDAQPTKKVTPPTVAQVRALLKATAGTELGRLLVVLVNTGARIGEVLAASWDQVDLDEGVMRIDVSVTRDRQRRVVRGMKTKTGSGRTVALGDSGVAALRDQRTYVATRRLSASYWVDENLLFPTEIGTMPDPRNLRKVLRPIAEDVSFPGSFHALRHFVASVALADGGNEFLVAKVLGHARRSTTTDVYGHLLGDEARGVSEAVNRRLNGA